MEFQKSWCKNVRGKVYQGRTVENIYVEEVKLFCRRCPFVPLPQDEGEVAVLYPLCGRSKTFLSSLSPCPSPRRWRGGCNYLSFNSTSLRKIRLLIESNAQCRYLKNLTCKGTVLCAAGVSLSEAPSPLRVLFFGVVWCSNFVGSESGQKQSFKTPAEYGLQHNSTPPPPPPSRSHTLSVHTVLWLWEGGEVWGRWTREKGQ